MKNILVPLLLVCMFCGCDNDEKKSNDISLFYELSTDTINSHYIHELEYGELSSVSEEYWDSINGTVHSLKQIKRNKLDSTYKTFGWHMYSHGSTYRDYDFSLLWGVSYFAYIINPENGSYKNIHQWKTTGLIDSAKVYDCNIFLTVANFGKENNATFLNNPKSQETLIDSVLSLLSLRKANGVNIDFESVSVKSKQQFTEFIKNISVSLKQENPEYMVSLCLYAIDYNDIFDIKSIDSYVDIYTVMGYDYYGSFSSNAGPIAPLKSSTNFGKHSLETSVNSYLDRGVVPSKLIVGLPHYGADWAVDDTTLVSRSKKFHSHKAYKTIKKDYIDSLQIPVLFDSVSISNYMNYEMDGERRQMWFDGVQSLSIKYDWIKDKKLGGVGIWALGFDNGEEELWNLMSDKFGQQ